MTLKTGRKCTWEEIEVGEIFAWNGCWCILQKIDEEESLFLATDQHILVEPFRKYFFKYMNIFYKLPKSVQRLWKEE